MYTVTWRVKEHLNGQGHERTLANGEADREGDSAAEVRALITTFLQDQLPQVVNQVYRIEIEISEAQVS